MRQPITKIITCRSAAESLEIGAIAGYFCKICGKEVQVSPTGRLQIDDGGVVVCNPCGFKFAEEANRVGKLGGIGLNPAMQRQMEARAAEEATKKKAIECDICSAHADHFWVWSTRGFVAEFAMGRRVENPEGARWAICDRCRPVWETRDAHALAMWSQISQGAPGGFVAQIEPLYVAVFGAIVSGPTLMEVL